MKPDSRLRILLAENCGVSTSTLARLLPQYRLQAELTTVPLERMEKESGDACILDAGDFDLAGELAGHGVSAVLLLTEQEGLADLYPACIAAGFLSGERDKPEFWLPQLLALCCRLREIRHREHDLQRKLDDTRLVNRAKLLLMSRLGMTEAQAHRYIEKTAMDIGASRRDVAVGIIRTYEE